MLSLTTLSKRLSTLSKRVSTLSIRLLMCLISFSYWFLTQPVNQDGGVFSYWFLTQLENHSGALGSGLEHLTPLIIMGSTNS